jgi:ATP-binding cassette subfamily B protein
VLSQLSFEVKKGESLAIVGPSGAGKTTIANIIPRFYDISGGDVKIGGVSVKDIALASLRKNVGIVQQNVYLFYGSVKENILFGRPGASDEEVIEAAKKAGAHEFIEKLENGYDTVCGERGLKLSGGQKQRIAIARALATNPKLLLLDEPAAGMNPQETAELMETIRFVRDKFDMTILLIEHDMSLVSGICDELTVLNFGQTLASGDTAEVLTNPEVVKAYLGD